MDLTSVDALQQDLEMVKTKIVNCDKRLEQASGNEAKNLEAARTYLEAVRDRIACALDLVAGRGFTIKNEGAIEVFEPDPKLAKLLKLAEEAGGKILSHEVKNA